MIRSIIVVSCVIVAIAGSASQAADLYWNGLAASGSAGGGSGAWSTTAQTWETVETGGVPTVWTDGDNGFLGGTAGTLDVQSALAAATITASTSGYTILSTNDSALAVSRIDISSLGANGQLNVGVRLTGTGPLSLAGAGDTTSTGGNNANLGIRLTNAANDFVGDVTITNRLVSYTSDNAFGNAANAIVMDGGGLLDNNTSVNLTRAIQVGAGGGFIRLWNASTPTWSGPLSGTGTVTRTDMGVLTLAGDVSGYAGTYTQTGYSMVATRITGGGSLGGNWTATSGTITLDGVTDQAMAGVLAGTFRKSGSARLVLSAGTVGGNWLIDGGSGITVDGLNDQVMTGFVSGSGALTKLGSGTLTMTARSTTSGPIAVDGGTLRLNDGRSMSGPITVASGATLAIESSGNGGYYQPASLDLTDASVTSVVASGNRYHGIYTEVVNVHGTGTSTVAAPLFMNKTGDAAAYTLAITVDPVATGSVSGPIANHPDVGGGSLQKLGGGTLALSGASTFSGNVALAAGTIAVARSTNNANPTATALGNMTVAGRTIDVATGATLVFVSADAIGQYNYKTPVTIVADGGTITRQYTATDYFNSLGDVVLRNAAHLTSADGKLGIVQSFALNGGVAVSGTTGSFIDSTGTSFNGLHLGTVSGTTLFDVATTGDAIADLTVSAPLVDKVLGGGAVLAKGGDGVMRTTVANSYSGGTTLRAGTLVTTVNGGFGSGAIAVNEPATGGSATSLLVDAGGGTITIGQAITVANEGSGVTTIGSSANGGANFASFTGPLTIGRDVTLTSAAGGDRTEFTGGISGTGGITVASATGSRVLFRNTANTYSGSTSILVGSVLQLGEGAATSTSLLPDEGAVVVGGELRIAKGGGSETVGVLLGSGTVATIAGSATLVLGEGGGSGTFAGSLAESSGVLSVTKAGTGSQTLSGSNSHTGPTSVQQGTLRLTNPGASVGSTLAVVAGGTAQMGDQTVVTVAGLDLAGNGLVDLAAGAMTVQSGLSPTTLVAELLEGRGDGSWNGTSGITSSAAAAAAAISLPRTVGWLDNGDGSVTAAYAAPGDTNLDWNVDILDAANFFAGGKYDTGLPASWVEGDFGYDGTVDILDAADFQATGLFDTGSYNAPPGASPISPVPEPSAALAVAIGTLALAVGRSGWGFRAECRRAA